MGAKQYATKQKWVTEEIKEEVKKSTRREVQMKTQ